MAAYATVESASDVKLARSQLRCEVKTINNESIGTPKRYMLPTIHKGSTNRVYGYDVQSEVFEIRSHSGKLGMLLPYAG